MRALARALPTSTCFVAAASLGLSWLVPCCLGAISLGSASLVAGCGPSVPARYVVEREVGGLAYRRYQRVLDVEFPVEGNPAVGHTATYVLRSGRGDVPYVNVFVTVYESAPSLTAEVRRQLRTLGSYEVSVEDVGGGRAWALDGGEGDRWVLWVSANRVVKVGGQASEELIGRVISEYMSVYPSDLDEHGRAREGTASFGDAGERGVEDEDLELPRSLESESESAAGGAADGDD